MFQKATEQEVIYYIQPFRLKYSMSVQNFLPVNKIHTESRYILKKKIAQDEALTKRTSM